MTHHANDTDRQSLLTAERRRQIEELAKQYPSATLAAAADRALHRELEASVFQNLPCDEVIK